MPPPSSSSPNRTAGSSNASSMRRPPSATMRSIREQDDGRPFNTELFAAHIRQALDMKSLVASSVAGASPPLHMLRSTSSSLVQQNTLVSSSSGSGGGVGTNSSASPLVPQQRQSRHGTITSDSFLLTNRTTPLGDAGQDISRVFSESFTGNVIPAPMLKQALANGSVADFADLGRQYQSRAKSATDFEGDGGCSTLPAMAGPASMLRADMKEWRTRRAEAERALGEEALAMPSRSTGGKNNKKSDLDPTGRMSSANAVRMLHQRAKLRLVALEQGISRSPFASRTASPENSPPHRSTADGGAGLAGHATTSLIAIGNPSLSRARMAATLSGSNSTTPMQPLQRLSASSTPLVVLAHPDADVALFAFEERRIREQLAEQRRAEQGFDIGYKPRRVEMPDPTVNKVRQRLLELEAESRNQLSGLPAANLRRRRYAKEAAHESVNAGAGGDADKATHGGLRKGKKADDLNRWVDPCEMPLEIYTETGEPFSEWDMNMPEQDLHLYQLYCFYNNMIIVIRPVSASVPLLNMGTFFLASKHCDALGEPLPKPEFTMQQIREVTTHDCRIRGKSINVSLKSSTYPPIDGLIPVNPALGKAYLEAQRRERELEDMILNAQGGDRVVTISLLKKLKLQKAQAGSLTQAFRRDIEFALQRSNRECSELMEQYKADLVLTVDKAAVSQQYIGRFNEAQFLGTTNATWRSFPVYYQELSNGEVVRNDRDVPYFYIRKGAHYYQFLPEATDIDKIPERDASTMKAVLVVTHRMFFVSPTTQRIEEDPESYLIGPDFDGLCYGRLEDTSLTLEARIEWATKLNSLTLIRSMGLVNDFDIQHINEVRELTQWKQNHGYEATNVVKTQPLTPGPYVVITPNLTSILKDVHQIMGYYRTAWKSKYPLVLNPNWRVAIDSDYLPRWYGEDLVLPIVDDCGYAALMSRIEAGEGGGVTHDKLKAQYTPMSARLQKIEADRQRSRKLASASTPNRGAADEDLDVFALLCRVYDRKHLANTFFDVRRWQLLPPWRSAFAPENATVLEKNAADLYIDPDFEVFRATQVAPRMEAFLQEAREFEELHGPGPFLDLLHMYVNPEPDHAADSQMGSSLGSLAELVA